MNTLTSVLSAASSAAICAACVWAILSEQIHDRVIIRFGLAVMAIGFGAVALHAGQELAGMDNASGLLRAVLLINSGIAVLALGVVLRLHSDDPEVRKITEWGALEGEDAAGDDGKQ